MKTGLHALFAALLLCVASEAHATSLTVYPPPTGFSGGRITVAKKVGGSGVIPIGSIVVVFQVGYWGNSGACTFTVIGDETGLDYDSVTIVGKDTQTDEVFVWADEDWYADKTICGGTVINAFTEMGAGTLTVSTLGGDDVVWVSGMKNDLGGDSNQVIVDMGSGYDHAVVGNVGSIYGGADEDTIIGLEARDAYMYGGSYADLFCAYWEQPRLMDGGTGADTNWGQAATMISTSQTATEVQCNEWYWLVQAQFVD